MHLLPGTAERGRVQLWVQHPAAQPAGAVGDRTAPGCPVRPSAPRGLRRGSRTLRCSPHRSPCCQQPADAQAGGRDSPGRTRQCSQEAVALMGCVVLAKGWLVYRGAVARWTPALAQCEGTPDPPPRGAPGLWVWLQLQLMCRGLCCDKLCLKVGIVSGSSGGGWTGTFSVTDSISCQCYREQDFSWAKFSLFISSVRVGASRWDFRL